MIYVTLLTKKLIRDSVFKKKIHQQKEQRFLLLDAKSEKLKAHHIDYYMPSMPRDKGRKSLERERERELFWVPIQE